MDDLDLIRSFSPETVEPSPEAQRKVHAAIAARFERPPARRPAPHGPFRRRPWLAPIAGLAACALAAVLLAVGLGSGTSESAAAQVLTRAAAALREQRLARGHYYFQRFREVVTIVNLTVPGPPGTPSYRATFVSEGDSWIGAGGSGRISSKQSLTFPTPQDRARWIAAGSPSLGSLPLGSVERNIGPADTTNSAFAYFGLTVRGLLGLVDNPAALAERLKTAALHPVAHRLAIPDAPAPGIATDEAGLAAALLGGGSGGSQPLPPRLSAALYELLARLPGVKLLTHATDHSGRAGIAITLGPSTMIFDPHTYSLLGREEFDPDGPWYYTSLASGVVGSLSSHLGS